MKRERSEKLSLLFLAFLACLLLSGALSDELLGHTHALFSGSSTINVEVSTGQWHDWHIDYEFIQEDLGDLPVGGSGTTIKIGTITSKVDNLKITCSIDGPILDLHTCRINSPTSFVLNDGESQDIFIILKSTGSQKGKSFEGTINVSFDDFPDAPPILVNVSVYVPR